MADSIQLHDKTFVPLINETDISNRVMQLAAEIESRYREHNPLLIAVLNGAFIFAADLMKNLRMDCAITFVKIQSYVGLASSRNTRSLIGLDQDIEGRHVLIIEDIVDTGRTMAHLLPELAQQNPASLGVVTLFSKTEAREVAVKLDMIGFEIPNRFIVGYGLDYDGLGRNLRGIYQLAD
jgi:hypoxanthine phosphoribosyltransferase